MQKELTERLMRQAQVFASAWSLVGSCFDAGHAMADAEEAKQDLEGMVLAALAGKDAEIAALRKELGNAKGLICQVYSLLPLLTPATDLIEKKTGNWFAFGVDRSKSIARAAQPEKRPENCGTGFCSCIECPFGAGTP